MTREEVIIRAAIAALPECKRATPDPKKAAATARAAGICLADELGEELALGTAAISRQPKKGPKQK